MSALPERIDTEEQLDDLLSEPSPAAVEVLSRLDGDLLILGVSGKMGPTLARMALRAGPKRRVIGVARFTQPGVEAKLRGWGVETIRCDLLDRRAVAALPDAANVIAMPTLKFGAAAHPAQTWAINTWAAGLIAERFPESRLVAFSTGNVYPLTPIHLGGSRETDELNPAGEYGMSCLGRERLYEHFGNVHLNPTAILRLNYACELRYGVLVDLARQVWKGDPVDLSMGAVNVIWQGDANAMALASLDHAAYPPQALNIAGPETLSVRAVCTQLGELLGKAPRFTGAEAPDALLSNGQVGHRLFGYPRVPILRLLEWIAAWVRDVGLFLDKPTKFQVRSGAF